MTLESIEKSRQKLNPKKQKEKEIQQTNMTPYVIVEATTNQKRTFMTSQKLNKKKMKSYGTDVQENNSIMPLKVVESLMEKEEEWMLVR